MFIIYNTKDHAEGFIDYSNVEKDYPKEGKHVGVGIPCAPGEGITLCATDYIKHPKEDLWAVSINRIEDLKPPDKTPVNLDESWYPPKDKEII